MSADKINNERVLIVNADDFGLSTSVNDGILRAHRDGIVTSTSLMVRGAAVADAVERSRAHPGLAIGLHIDLGEWTLRNGEWIQNDHVVDVSDAAAVRAEIERQLLAFRTLLGRDPTHLDSHQHAHRREPARPIVRELSRRLGIPFRHEVNGRIRYCGEFYGQDTEGRPIPGALTVDALLRIVEGIGPGVTELGCHPGEEDPGAAGTMYDVERATETRILCDPRLRDAIGAAGIRLASFADFAREAAIPRIVWMLWLQGFDRAPRVVQLCRKSWKAMNPGWSVVELSEANLSQYVDATTLAEIGALNLPPQKQSNLLRLYLLDRYGGVWVDATGLCAQPLDRWLPQYTSSGFFAFRFAMTERWLKSHERWGFRTLTDRSGDRIVANWFIASAKGNPLTREFYAAHKRWFEENRAYVEIAPTHSARVPAMSILGRNARLAQLWTLSAVARVTRTCPYFIFHYHFARFVREDPTARAIWERTPVFPVRNLMDFGRALASPVTDAQREMLKAGKEPAYKLDWKKGEEAKGVEGSLLEYLERTIDSYGTPIPTQLNGSTVTLP